MININKSTEGSKSEGVGADSKKPELPPLDERKAEKFRDFVKQDPEELKLKQKKAFKEASTLSAFASLAEEVSEKAEKGVGGTLVPHAYQEAKDGPSLEKKGEPGSVSVSAQGSSLEKEELYSVDPQELSKNLEKAFVALGNPRNEENSMFLSKKEDVHLPLKYIGEESSLFETPDTKGIAAGVAPALNHPSQGTPAHFSSLQAGSKVDQPAAILELAEKMVQSIVEKTDKTGDSKLIVFLRSPPIFDGAVVEINAVQSAPNEFNIKFSNLLPEAHLLLSNRENIDLLHNRLQEKGIVLHQIQTSEQGIYTSIQTGEGRGYEEQSKEGGQGEGQQEQERPEDPFNVDPLEKKSKKM